MLTGRVWGQAGRENERGHVLQCQQQKGCSREGSGEWCPSPRPRTQPPALGGCKPGVLGSRSPCEPPANFKPHEVGPLPVSQVLYLPHRHLSEAVCWFGGKQGLFSYHRHSQAFVLGLKTWQTGKGPRANLWLLPLCYGPALLLGRLAGGTASRRASVSSQRGDLLTWPLSSQVRGSLPATLRQHMDAGGVRMEVIGVTNGSVVVEFHLLIIADVDVQDVSAAFLTAFQTAPLLEVIRGDTFIQGMRGWD